MAGAGREAEVEVDSSWEEGPNGLGCEGIGTGKRKSSWRVLQIWDLKEQTDTFLSWEDFERGVEENSERAVRSHFINAGRSAIETSCRCKICVGFLGGDASGVEQILLIHKVCNFLLSLIRCTC
ncbi:hypothetical protein M5K25_018689 [Dendrobium thyrsiflorum]|uniref:Uncharacterized protein n=1 Tax=Dendrobium thyrsiflorum TaxID=117978 RepID=A0ABD0UJ85_DENTH